MAHICGLKFFHLKNGEKLVLAELEKSVAFAAIQFFEIENVLVKRDGLFDIVEFDCDVVASVNLHTHDVIYLVSRNFVARLDLLLFFSVTEHLGFKRTRIDSCEAFFHRACEQWNVRNFAEMFGDEPDRFFRRHPVLTIKSSEIHRARISPQGALAAQIEVDVEVTHGQFPQTAINRLPIPAAGEIRFRHRAPMSAQLENGDYMIGVLLCFQIENERWKSEDAERCCSENPAFEARCSSIAQDLLRRSRREAKIVG